MRVVCMLSVAVMACHPEVEIQVVQDVCSADQAAAEDQLTVDEDGEELLVLRFPRLTTEGADFDPIIETDGKRIDVFEEWDFTNAVAEVEACYVTGMRLSQAPGNNWRFVWYEGEDSVLPAHSASWPE